MSSMMQKNLTLEIENYISSVGEVHKDGVEYQKSKPKKIKSRDKIVEPNPVWPKPSRL